MRRSDALARAVPDHDGPIPGARRAPLKVAYIMSRFPKLTETFVLYEMLAVEREGVAVEVFPLLRERQTVAHPEAARLVERARFRPFLSARVLAANWHFFRRDPRRYAGVWRDVLRGTWGSLNFFVGGVTILPKVAAFAREMEEEGVRHVHAHFANHPALAAFIVHRLTGIPFSFTAHGSDLHVDRRMLDRKVGAAAFAVAISEFNRRLMMSACGDEAGEKIHVIHCGVDETVFGATRPAERRSRVEIVCVASFEQVKGHRFLVEACRRLGQRGVDFVCHLVGDGPLRRDVKRRIAAAGLRDRVIVHGPRPRQAVARMVAGSDIVVLASAPTRSGKREGIPVALMEAMATGRPVVASATGGIPELVAHEDTGLLVAPGDAAALADALETLARDAALRTRMGAAGAEKVRREFDLHANARELVTRFRESARRSDVDPHVHV